MSRLLPLLALLASALLLVPGCGDRRGGGASCYDSADCDNDEDSVEACIAGRCESVDCLSSVHCELNQYCDVEDQDYRCRDGCQTDTDCLAGYSCNDDNECEQRPCRSSVLDCDFGEICNTETGACEQDRGRDHCSPCDPARHDLDDNGTLFNVCDDRFLGHQECGPGAVCAQDPDDIFGDGYCQVPCETQADCPAGFTCDVLYVFGNSIELCPKPVFSTPTCNTTFCAQW